MPQVGKKAPAFSLPSTSGRTVSLGDFAGRTVVLYFYPRDNTPGCTRESCDFRDRHAELARAGAVVLGVSGDSLKSHDGFRAKYSLPFELLSDAGNAVATKYGAYGEKNMYGRKVMGVIRSTFVIDGEGRIAAAWSPVKVDGHAEAVLAAVRGEGADGKSKPASKPAPSEKTARKAAKKKTRGKPAKKA